MKAITRYSFAICLLFVSFGCGSKPPLELYKPTETPAWETVETEQEQQQAPEAERPRVRFNTSLGSFEIELFQEEAPATVENFLQYVEDGFYEGTVFHRVIPGFVVQGGGLTENLREKETRPAIVNEAGNGLRNLRGTLSMARTSELNSATSQFFINVVDNAFLNGDGVTGGYAVFGRVVEGMAVVDQMTFVETGDQGVHQDVPKTPIVVESTERLN